MIKLSDLKVNPNNPRLIKDDKFKKLCKSLKDFPKMMELRPIVIDERGVILGGNMRFQAIKANGHIEIPDEWVKRADELTEEQKREFIVKDNVGFGEWDFEILANNWDAEELDTWGLDLPEFKEVDPEVLEDDYEVPDEIETDIVLGDLIEIGPHRLLCGDSTDVASLDLVMRGESANLVTDPPYGINANKQTLGAGKKKFHRGDDWDTEVPDFFHALAMVDKSIIWGGNYFTDRLPPNNDWLCWHKKNDGRSFSEFELAWTNIGKNCRHLSHHWGGEEKIHPTMKPVNVIAWCIGFLDDKPIVDVFLGSGTTMVAAHQLKRKCYGIELDPKYCQVIVDRMRNLDPDLIIKRNGEIWH